MGLTFDPRADKHGVPRKSTWRVVMTTQPVPKVTNWGEAGLWYEGADERGVWIEVGTVQRGSNEMVYHAMPISHRHAARENQ